MEFAATALSTLMSVFVLVLFVAGVMKLFQIHTVLTEIKDSLRTAQMSRPAPSAMSYVPAAAPVSTPVPAAPPVNLHDMTSGEDMLRALDAQIKLDELTARSEASASANQATQS